MSIFFQPGFGDLNIAGNDNLEDNGIRELSLDESLRRIASKKGLKLIHDATTNKRYASTDDIDKTLKGHIYNDFNWRFGSIEQFEEGIEDYPNEAWGFYSDKPSSKELLADFPNHYNTGVSDNMTVSAETNMSQPFSENHIVYEDIIDIGTDILMADYGFYDPREARTRLSKIMEAIGEVEKERLLKNVTTDYLHQDLKDIIKRYLEQERELM